MSLFVMLHLHNPLNAFRQKEQIQKMKHCEGKSIFYAKKDKHDNDMIQVFLFTYICWNRKKKIETCMQESTFVCTYNGQCSVAPRQTQQVL